MTNPNHSNVYQVPRMKDEQPQPHESTKSERRSLRERLSVAGATGIIGAIALTGCGDNVSAKPPEKEPTQQTVVDQNNQNKQPDHTQSPTQVDPGAVTETDMPTTVNETEHAFQTPELEARYESIKESLRMPFEQYSAREAHLQVAEHFEDWASLAPTEGEIDKYHTYMADHESEDTVSGIAMDGSGGVIIDVDQKAYSDALFVNGSDAPFSQEMNEINQWYLYNYNNTYNEANPYQQSLTRVDEPTISDPASDNHLSPSITHYQLTDNANKNSVREIRTRNGDEIVKDETLGIYVELVVVGEGADAEWKIQHAEIATRE